VGEGCGGTLRLSMCCDAPAVQLSAGQSRQARVQEVEGCLVVVWVRGTGCGGTLRLGMCCGVVRQQYSSRRASSAGPSAGGKRFALLWDGFWVWGHDKSAYSVMC
jgi:hypothetical protein